MGGRQLLDPRWHWMRGALQRLYAELDDDAVPVALAISVTAGDEVMYYAVEPGSTEIDRRVVTDMERVVDVAAETTVDVSPEDVTG